MSSLNILLPPIKKFHFQSDAPIDGASREIFTLCKKNPKNFSVVCIYHKHYGAVRKFSPSGGRKQGRKKKGKKNRKKIFSGVDTIKQAAKTAKKEKQNG